MKTDGVSPVSVINIAYVPLDVADPAASDLASATDVYDIVICNAGISISGDFREIPFADEERVFAVNTLGHIQLVKQLLRTNWLTADGRIAFICSATVFFPFPISLAYAASKSALDGFVAALDAYLHGCGITVTRVYPGPMRTDHRRFYAGFDRGRGADPECIAPVVIRGIMDRKRRVLPDSASRLLYLLSLVPGLLSRPAHNQYRDNLRER